MDDVGELEMEGVLEEVGLGEGDEEAVLDGEELAEMDGVTEGDEELEGDEEREADGVVVGVTEGVEDVDGVTEGVTEGVGVQDGLGTEAVVSMTPRKPKPLFV